MDIKNDAVPVNCHILTNSPALHSLKRQQLVLLCKRNGIKASGKNTEIVEKLKAHAHRLNVDPSMLSQQPFSSDNDNKENRRLAVPRPSDQWTVIEEDSREIERVHLGLKDIREEVRQEMSTLSSMKSFGGSQTSTEFGGGTASSKGSSMTSSLKAFATSLKRSTSKLSSEPPLTTKQSTQPSTTNLSMHIEDPALDDMLAATSIPYDEQPHKYPQLPDPEPLDADDSRDQSMIELGSSTIRLVTSAPTAESPPALRPFTPAFEPSYSPGTPSVPSIYPALPLETDSNPTPPGAFPSMLSTPSAFPATSTSPVPPRSPAPPFLFGSPAHRISNTEFNSAAASVLTEMNARLGLVGTTSEVGLELLQNRRAGTTSTVPSAPQGEKPHSNVTSKFDRAHQREFERMEGLGTWYAKRNAGDPGKPHVASKKRKSDALGGPARRPARISTAQSRRSSRVVTPGTRRSLVAIAAAEEMEGRKVKRVRISTANGGGNPPAERDADRTAMDVDEEMQETNEEREKERAAIKKKLEVSRARRRSSMGRVSVGGGRPPLIPNQPKKGITTKFGFLSSAKTLVKSVWNRGIGNTETQLPKASASTNSKPSIPANRPVAKKNTPNVLVKDPPAAKSNVAKAPPVKVPVAKAEPVKPGLRVPSTGLGLGRKTSTRMRTDSSVGAKSNTMSSAGTRSSTVASTNSSGPVARRAPIPSFQSPTGRISRANSLLSSGTAGSKISAGGTTSSRGGSIPRLGSMGVRKHGLSIDGGTGSAVRKRTSTLFAPTASSLAKMQSNVKPPSMSGAGNSSIAGIDVKGLAKVSERPPQSTQAVPSFTFTSPPPPPPPPASSPSKGPGSIFSDGAPTFGPTQNLSSVTGGQKPRVLPARRPRISRSRVIAKVGAQRAASGSSLASNTSARRSLNVAKSRGSLSTRMSGIGVKSRGGEAAAAMSARKRLRQSEILRRRSKVSGISPALQQAAREHTGEDEDDSEIDDDGPEASVTTQEVSMED